MFEVTQDKRVQLTHHKFISSLSNDQHDRMLKSNNYSHISQIWLRHGDCLQLNDNSCYNIFEMLKCKLCVKPIKIVLDNVDAALLSLIERKKELGKACFYFVKFFTDLIIKVN